MNFVNFGLFELLIFVSNVLNEPLQHNIGDFSLPAVDFHDHATFEPIFYHGKHKRRINTTKELNGLHAEHLIVKIEIDNAIFLLDLVLNKRLLSGDFFHRYQLNGTDNVIRHTHKDVDLCEYHGKVRDKPNSWVALSTCDDGLDGVIYDGNELHYVSSRHDDNDDDYPDNSSNRINYFYKHSNLADQNKTCGYQGSENGGKHEHNHGGSIRHKRDIKNELIRGPYNANRESKYVELVLVIDNREYKELGENRQRVIQHCKTIANIINGLYSPLNIFIALVGVVIWTERDEISFSKNGDETLTNFLHYRREKLIKEHPNDNAQLLSKFNFDNGVVGKALKGPICTYEYSGGVNVDHSPVIGLVATTIAHEMGHNFGMEHDTNDCKCPESRCIMAPSSSTEAPIHWSSCSLNYLLLAFTHGMDYCLKNKPEALFDSPVCGNGFVEPGEQCDCGLPDHCDNSCCNPTTCMLYANASCATGECCDLTTCKPKSAGVECRSADYECDLPEYCTGQSEFCPPDVYKMDTEVCGDGKAYCYHGFCRTRTDQCKLLWGETGKSSDEQCYKMNTKGTRHGNCGYNKFNKSFMKCQNESVLCGMLHCFHLNERLEFGMESVAILSQSFINNKKTIIPCRNAIVDLGINQIDPGLSPDGAICGEGKMCVNQRCMSVESLRLNGGTCPNDCNGNGWCNNLGHCHCKSGYSPPFCQAPGVGGSEDSGPASDPNKHNVYIIAMFIFFLGIVPGIGLGLYLHFYLKRNNFYGNHVKSLPSIPKTTRQLKTVEDGNGDGNSAKKTEDNHSLLHNDSPAPPIRFFGRFKPFLISPKKAEVRPARSAPPPPLPTSEGTSNNSVSSSAHAHPTRVTKEIEVVRSAPPPPPTAAPPKTSLAPPEVPAVPSVIQTQNAVARANFFNKPIRVPSLRKYPLSNPFSQPSQSDAAPALPPLNPNQSGRPIISSPVLESSTSTAKELISPIRKAPTVPIPTKHPEIESDKMDFVKPTPPPNVVIETNNKNTLKRSKDGTGNGNGISLNRIASFLRNDAKKSSSNLQHRPSQIKANKIDRDQLRSMEISIPIPQSEIDIAKNALPISSETAQNIVVMRSKSMRNGDVNKRPIAIPTFGSMRNPSGLKRPVSIPCGVRPKIPPPPRPPPPLQNQYDDCLNQKEELPMSSPMSTDNIYAVIEDPPKEAVTSPSNASNQNDSFGLLGEIVSEIKNRNFDSIYSTSTLARRKREEEAAAAAADETMSTCTENTYSNMSSSTASYIQPIQPQPQVVSGNNGGYVQPSTIPKPVEKPFKKVEGKLNLTTTSKSSSKEKLNDVKQKKKESPTKQTSPIKQTQTPSVRSRRSSPVGGAGAAGGATRNRLTSNSPDLVISCNSNKSSKPPDVLNRESSNKKPTVSVKPNVSKAATTAKSSQVSKPPGGKVLQTRKSSDDLGKEKIGGVNCVNLPNRSNSRVAALQKKFQN